MAEKRFVEDMKTLHLFSRRKANKISAKNAIFRKSHKDQCKTLDAERKSRLSNFRRAKCDLEQRLTRHAQDSLSFDDIKSLSKYVDDGRDEEQFCSNFLSARRRSGSTASISSTSNKSFSIANSARVNSVQDTDKADSKVDQNNNSGGLTKENNVMDCKTTQGYSKAELGNCPLNKLNKLCANVQDLVVRGNNKFSIKKLTPIPQEQDNDEQEGDVHKTTEDFTHSQTKQRIESWMMDVSKERALPSNRTDYGWRRSISLDEGSRLQEKTLIADVVHKSQSSQELLPRFQQRRRSVDVVGLQNSLEKDSEKRVRRNSLDCSSREQNKVELLKKANGKSNSTSAGYYKTNNVEPTTGENGEGLLPGTECHHRQAPVKLYSEEPFYVRRKKQLTRKMSWQSTVMPEETSKTLHEIQGEKPKCVQKKDEELTPLRNLLPPILLPSIFSQQNVKDRNEALQQRAQHHIQKSGHSKDTDRIRDCRYLRMPIKR